MAKTTNKAAAPATAAPAATDTAPVAKSTVVVTEAPSSQVETSPNSLEKSLADIGITFGSSQEPIEHPAAAVTDDKPARAEPGQEPSPALEAATENVDVDIEGTVIPAEAETTEDLEAEETTVDESTSQWPESALHEVSKLRQQKRELKSKAADAVSKLSEMESKLSEAEKQLASENPTDAGYSAPPRDAGGLDDVKTLPELRQRTTEAEQLLEWCDDQLIALREDPETVERTLRANKIVLNDRDGQEDFSRDRMEGFILNTRRKVDTTLRKAVPAREKYLTISAESETNAKAFFPWYADKTSEEYQLSQQILRMRPEIRQWPDWKIVLGVQVKGLQELRKMQKAAPGAKAAPKAPTVIAPRLPGIPAKAPARLDQKAASAKSASEVLRNPGNGDGTVSAISALLAAT